jgi:hypothetical protein
VVDDNQDILHVALGLRERPIKVHGDSIPRAMIQVDERLEWVNDTGLRVFSGAAGKAADDETLCVFLNARPVKTFA